MNELPRTINGATLPDNEVWWNPQNLDLERFGPDHRPMTVTEFNRTEKGVPCSFWYDEITQWREGLLFAKVDHITYRIPSNTPFLMPEKAWEPKFQVGDWVKFGCYEPSQIVRIQDRRYEMANHHGGWAESDLTWTLGPSINGHTLQPGQRWHAEADWTQKDLPSPYRPAIVGERFDKDGEAEYLIESEWVKQDGHFLVDRLTGMIRTTRPLPKVEKVEPTAHPAVTEEMVAEFARYVLSQPPTDGDLTDIRLALSHAFSQVLTPLEERLDEQKEWTDSYKKRLSLASETLRKLGYSESIKGGLWIEPDTLSELQKARAEIADLTRRLEECWVLVDPDKDEQDGTEEVFEDGAWATLLAPIWNFRHLPIRRKAARLVKFGEQLPENREALLTRRIEELEGHLANTTRASLLADRDAHKARADIAEQEKDDLRHRNERLSSAHKQEIERANLEKARADKAEAVAANYKAIAAIRQHAITTASQQLAQSAADNETYQQAANGWLEKFQQVTSENAELRQQLAEKEASCIQWHQSYEDMKKSFVSARDQGNERLSTIAELRKQLVNKDKELQDTKRRCSQVYEEWQSAGRHYDAHLAAFRAEIASLQWVSLAERKPTAEDADGNDIVEVLHPDGGVDTTVWRLAARSDCGYTHWRRTNLPVEKVEQADEFQEWFCKMYGYPTDATFFQAMRSAWNKAREGKP